MTKGSRRRVLIVNGKPHIWKQGHWWYVHFPDSGRFAWGTLAHVTGIAEYWHRSPQP